MSTTLFVRLPHRPHDQPQPWRFGPVAFALVRDTATVRGGRDAHPARPQLLREGRAEIGELPAADRLVLIVAAPDVRLASAVVPPLAPARLKLALPNLVEDVLAADAQACHIAVGPALDARAGTRAGAASGARHRLLMVTERAWLRAVLDAFAGHRHRRRHLLPAQLCLPLPGTDAAEVPGASGAEGALAADGAADGMVSATVQPAAIALEVAAAPLADAESLLDSASQPSDAPGSGRHWQLTVRSGQHEGYGLLLGEEALGAWQALAPAGVWYGDAAAASLPTAVGMRPLDWALWIDGALECLQDRSRDLAQFDFGQGRADRWNLRAWRLPLALAAALLLVQIVGMNIHWLLLRNEQARLQAAQETVLRGAFPRLPLVVDAPLQMRRQVDQLRLASGRGTPDDFLPLADRFASAGRNLPPDALLSLEYRERALHATLKAGTDTGSLRNAARQAGLSMEEDRSPAQPGRGTATPAGTPPGSRWVIRPAR